MSKQHNYQLQESYGKLQDFLPDLIDRYQPEQIICFGYASESSISSGCFKNDANQYNVHFFLLMVTPGTSRPEKEAQDYANTHFHKGSVTLLVHSREAVNAALTTGQNFFVTVCNTGVVLYRQGGLTMLDVDLPQANPAGAIQEAERYYHSHSENTKGFIRSAATCLDAESYGAAVFLMHQVMEQACMALIRLHLGYRADIHNIGRLLSLCKCFSNKAGEIFPRTSKSEQRLFKVLTDSYSGARYNNSFKVTKEDAVALHAQVSNFLALSDTLCLRRLNVLRVAAAENRNNSLVFPEQETDTTTATNALGTHQPIS
jgi:HEPN domain-containing protein